MVVGLDPNCYLFQDLDNETLDIARFNLCRIAKNLKKNKAKALYHQQMKYAQNVTDLFNDSSRDPVIIAFRYECDDVLEILELENIYSTSQSYKWTNNDLIDCMLNGIFEVQYTRYHNRIILSNDSEKQDIEINGIIFRHVDSIDEGKLNINLLCNIDIVSMDEWLYVYEWYFSRFDRKKIILSNYFRKSIYNFSNQLDVITSMIRGVYHPEYIYKQKGLDHIENMIECHPDKHVAKLEFSIYDEQKKEIAQNKSSICRVHIVPLSNRSGGTERIYYITDDVYYFILDCSGHDFDRKKYQGCEREFNYGTILADCKNETLRYKIKIKG
jgi:hypothetical protein